MDVSLAEINHPEGKDAIVGKTRQNRGNFLLSRDAPRGARASATIYSLIESAKLHSLEPYRYLRYVLTEIANGTDDLDGLLPHNLDPATIDC